MEKFVDRIAYVTVDAVSRGLLYMYRYKGLVNHLNSEIKMVNLQEEYLVSRLASEEREDGKTINDSVLNWQKEVFRIRESAEEFLYKCKNRHSWKCIPCLPIPRPVSRFRQGRKAVRMAKRVAELVDSGKELMSIEVDSGKELKSNEIYGVEKFPKTNTAFQYCKSSEDNFPKTNTAFQYFKSREDAYEELWNALLTECGCMIVGIYGTAGVGKTRMAEQIEEKAIEKKAFDTVARADVGSGKVNVIHLQDQIAEYLNCHFESQDNVDQRASQLINSMMNRGKILIILDDVWSAIPLNLIGIPFGNSGSCKILLTSQEIDVCLQNNCEHPVQITPLTIDEGWDLFKNIVGTFRMDCLQDESLAKEVCNQCAGLPLLIHVVGKALKSLSHNDWEETLNQLKNCKVDNISETGSEELDACLRLSTFINFP